MDVVTLAAALKLSRAETEQLITDRVDEIVRESVSEFTIGMVVDTVAKMTDVSKIYVYAGSETGYTNGHWYYHNGTAWTDGGVYTAPINIDTTLTVSGKAADAKKVGDAISGLKEDLSDLQTDVENGNFPEMAVGSADQLISDNYVVENEPYQFRRSGGSASVGTRMEDAIVGGSIVWNQHARYFITGSHNGIEVTISDTQFTANGTASGDSDINLTESILSYPKDHVLFLLQPEGASSSTYWIRTGASEFWNYNTITKASDAATNTSFRLRTKSGVTLNNLKFYLQFFDLTAMFGSTIADYIYSLEQANQGDGIAFFRKFFPNDYYEYNAGELMSVSGLSEHKTVGFNVWDEEWEVGAYDVSTGLKNNNSGQIRSKNRIRVLPNTTHYIKSSDTAYILFYDKNDVYFGEGRGNGWDIYSNNAIAIPSNCNYIRFYLATNYGTTYNHDICINLSDPAKNGTYEPYKGHSYPLDNSLTLRGIPKLDSNNQLYFDGDRYLANGVVERRYGIVDLGTLTWSQFTGSTNPYFYAVPGMKSQTSGQIINAICSKYISIEAVTGYMFFGLDSTEKMMSAKGEVLFIQDNTYLDVATFKTAMSGVYLIYELTTPTTETADTFHNPQIVDPEGTEEYICTSLVPVGHETKYFEDLKGKLENLPTNFSTLIAPTEATYTATRNYTTGELLIVNNILYKVTSNIANGGTITPNTNVLATTLSEVIASLS